MERRAADMFYPYNDGSQGSGPMGGMYDFPAGNYHMQGLMGPGAPGGYDAMQPAAYAPHPGHGALMPPGGDSMNGAHMHQMGHLGHGPASSSLSTIMEDAVKKVKLDDGSSGAYKNMGTPSRVVHMRNVPSEVDENEIVQLVLRFGRVTNVLLLKKKNQACIEMSSIEEAERLVRHFVEQTVQLKNKQIFAQFSNHKQLTTDPSPSVTRALEMADSFLREASEHPERVVLRAVVERRMYPVTVDVLYQIFSRYGVVEKIITFTKNDQLQAFIQFADAITALLAKTNLDNQNIYTGCNTLRLEFSKMRQLEVKHNNERMRDFTVAASNGSASSAPGFAPMSPGGPPPGYGGPPGPNLMGSPGGYGGQPHPGGMNAGPMPPMRGGMSGFDSMPHPGRGGGPAPTGLSGDMMSQMSLGTLASMLAQNPAAAAALQTLVQAATGAQPSPPVGGPQMQMNAPSGGFQGGSPVVLVSNLDEKKATPDNLFILFGVYGDVMRVKIIFNKKDSALVMYQDPSQAQTAIRNLDGVRLWGKEIRVQPSRHATVQLPKTDDERLTKDFSDSPLHRYKKPGSKNLNNIYPPSAVLHLSNIPQDVTEDDIRKIFEEHGFSFSSFKFFPKDRRMALCNLDNVEVATLALMDLHNYPIRNNQHLRVSFSKATMTPNSLGSSASHQMGSD